MWTQPPPLGRSLSKAPSGVILNLATVGFPGCEEPTLRVSVETKTVLAVTAAGVWLMDGVFIPFKFQILQGVSRYYWRRLSSRRSGKGRAVFRDVGLGLGLQPV